MIALTGWLALLCIPVALLSGALLGWFYLPDPASAHGSLVELESVVPFGALLRSLHSVSSHGALGTALLHFAAVLRQDGARDRSTTWTTGVWALALLGALAFSGRALPWDQHAGLSLQMADRFLRAGEVRPLSLLFGPLDGPLLLERVWLLHLGLTVGLAALLLWHLPLRTRLREWSADARARRRALAVGGGGLALLLVAGLVFRAPLGLPFAADAEQLARPSAEWYLRWIQLLSLRAGPAALITLGVLVAAAIGTPLVHRRLGPRRLRFLWAGLLALLLLLSLVPAS
jgi:hypothetical protein